MIRLNKDHAGRVIFTMACLRKMALLALMSLAAGLALAIILAASIDDVDPTRLFEERLYYVVPADTFFFVFTGLSAFISIAFTVKIVKDRGFNGQGEFMSFFWIWLLPFISAPFYIFFNPKLSTAIKEQKSTKGDVPN